MKIYRFLITTTIITVIALIYVNQQVALIRLSYNIKEKEKVYSDLLDRNKILLYNVKHLESPARLEKVLLAKNMKLEVPSKERVILVSAELGRTGTAEPKGIVKATSTFGRIRQAIASIFALGPEAQARPVIK